MQIKVSLRLAQGWGAWTALREKPWDVRSGSDSDIAAELPDVRSAPKSGHRATTSACPFRATNGFSGTYDGEDAECKATALTGKRSIRFRAVLRKLVAA